MEWSANLFIVSEAYMLGDVEVSSLKGAMDVSAIQCYRYDVVLIMLCAAVAREPSWHGRYTILLGRQNFFGYFGSL